MRERSVEVSQRFASAADRARWLTSHKPVPTPISIAQGDALDIGSRHFPPPPFGAIAGDVAPAEGPPTGAGPIDVGDGLFTYGQLLALPTDRPSRTVADRPGLDGAAPSIRADGVYSGANGGSDPCLPRASVRVWPATTLDHAGRARVRLPDRTGSLPPQGLVRRSLRARDPDVPQPAPASLHDAAVHEPDRNLDLLRKVR
jgi:hypothetical protein